MYAGVLQHWSPLRGVTGALLESSRLKALAAAALSKQVPLPGGARELRARCGELTWLILPVVICLSQRLSHACLSISFYTVKLRMAH